MKFLTLITAIVLCASSAIFASDDIAPTNIYLLAGQGADERLFKNLKFSDAYCVHYIEYTTPTTETTLQEYALTLSEQIDTSQAFILIGVSLGGMLATEMTDFLQPKKTIILASAKNIHELPRTFKFQKKVPLYKLAGKRNVKWGARFLQPIVEPDRRKESETYKAMLADKDPEFLLLTIPMIMQWERTTNDADIIHIHGTKDHTIPYKNVQCDYTIEGGSHMMTLTQSEKVNKILNAIL